MSPTAVDFDNVDFNFVICPVQYVIRVLKQGLLIITVFGLRGFGYIRLRKIMIKKKNVRLTKRNQSYAIFGYT